MGTFTVDDLTRAVELGYRCGYRNAWHDAGAFVDGFTPLEPYSETLDDSTMVLQEDAEEFGIDLSVPLFPGRQLDGVTVSDDG